MTWHAATLEIWRMMDLAIINESDMPNLTSLCLNFMQPWTTVTLHFFERQVPQLRNLCLTSGKLEEEELTLPGLVSLTLNTVSLPSLQSLLSALRNIPGLESLVLPWSGLGSSRVSEPTILSAVKLDRLSSLRLYGVGPHLLYLLKTLDTPGSETSRR